MIKSKTNTTLSIEPWTLKQQNNKNDKNNKTRDLHGKSKDSIRFITPLRKNCNLCLSEE